MSILHHIVQVLVLLLLGPLMLGLINKTKARSCRICHNPHAEVQERLIYPKTEGFGTWEIPIRFEATATGGGCSVGCHRTLRYDRVKAIEQQ